MLGDNQAVVNNNAIPQLFLRKQGNDFLYHNVCEAIVSQVEHYSWLDGNWTSR
jgi:hypothetical protein